MKYDNMVLKMLHVMRSFVTHFRKQHSTVFLYEMKEQLLLSEVEVVLFKYMDTMFYGNSLKTDISLKGVFNVFKAIFTAIFMIFLICIVGSIILEQFPSLVPLWEELKMHIATLYEMSVVKYGTGVTFLLIVAIFILVGSSKKG